MWTLKNLPAQARPSGARHRSPSLPTPCTQPPFGSYSLLL